MKMILIVENKNTKANTYKVVVVKRSNRFHVHLKTKIVQVN